MRRVLIALTAVVVVGAALSVTVGGQDTIEERARRIHREAIVLDTHIDTTQALVRPDWSFVERHEPPRGDGRASQGGSGTHVDLPRMREGGLDGAFFSIYMPGTLTGLPAVKRSLGLIDAVRGLVDRHSADCALALTADDVRAAHQAGKIAVLMGMEGGHMIDSSLSVLRTYTRLGVRYLTLTHSVNTEWADSSGDQPTHNGLTAFGKEVIRELNRLGVMVDISHVADKTFWDALEVSEAPLVASHSSCRALCGHARNLTDEMIRAMTAKGGVVQINYMTGYLDETLRLVQEKRRPLVAKVRADLEQKYPGPESEGRRDAELREEMAKLPALPTVSWERIVDHIDHVVKVAGIRHVGLGSDFDGAPMPEGMEDVTSLPKITEALLRRGYAEADVKLVLGGNLLRLMEQIEQVALRLRAAKS